MEKWLIITVNIIVIIFLTSYINAAIGITPPKVELDFKPNISYAVGFSVINVEPDQKLLVNVTGDFLDYIKVDKKFLLGSESFTVYIDLPNEGGKPGNRYIGVHVKEYKENAGGGFGTVLEIVPVIVIKVPYPGKYAEIRSFFASDTNEGTSYYFSLNLESLGSEDIEPSVKLEVYSNNELLDKYSLGKKLIPAKSTGVFEKTIEINKYSAGTYDVIAYVNVNDENNTVLKTNTTLRIGSLFVDIINWTKEVNKSRINPFNIEIESKWNNDIKNIYAEVNVSYENGTKADSFKTSPIELKKWEKGILNGYFNAENLIEGDYKANIDIIYEGINSSKTVDVKVVVPEVAKKFKINYILIIISVVILIIILTISYLFFRKNGKKSKTKN